MSNMTSTRSTLFSTNAIISSFDFSKNEIIPEKVISELNLVITKLTKTLNTKAGNSAKKREQYYRTVTRDFINRITKSTNTSEKHIMQYLYKRFSLVKKMK